MKKMKRRRVAQGEAVKRGEKWREEVCGIGTAAVGLKWRRWRQETKEKEKSVK